MKIYIMYKNGMFLSIRNFIYKLFGKNYTFEVPLKLIKKTWNDKYGSPVVKKVNEKVKCDFSDEGIPRFVMDEETNLRLN